MVRGAALMASPATSQATHGRRGPGGSLPPRMRVLYVSSPHRAGAWLADAFAADSACDVLLEKALGMGDGLARLRHDVFDAVLLDHSPGELDALDMVDGLRTGFPDQTLVILGAQSEQEMAALAYEVGADAYVCVNTATTRALIWTVARAMERHAVSAENRRLLQAEQHRLQQEQQEVERLLAQQRTIIAGLEALRGDPGDLPPPLDAPGLDVPPPLVSHYRELLRTYVIMGAGNLSAEMASLAELLASAGLSAQHTMVLHLRALEELIRGLGNRSARHVLNRADLLIVEVLMHLTERYRSRYIERTHPPRQLLFPQVTSDAA